MPFPPAPQGGFPEDRVVWVFGHPRSGTTWLGQLLTDGLTLKMWNEPYLGQFLNFTNLLRENEPRRFEDPTFWMSDPQEENWKASLNIFFMDVIARQGGTDAHRDRFLADVFVGCAGDLVGVDQLHHALFEAPYQPHLAVHFACYFRSWNHG